MSKTIALQKQGLTYSKLTMSLVNETFEFNILYVKRNHIFAEKMSGTSAKVPKISSAKI